MMKLFNTLTRQTEELKPISDNKILLYTCGPTVYDYPHIGNWAAFVRYDTLARALKASGYDTHWIMNITDVGHLVSDADEGEDKLEKGAKREGKTAWQIAKFYTEDFLRGVRQLNISIPSSNLPKATDNIPEQIGMVKVLEEKGYTYATSDGIYFDTSKLKDYGKLARLDIAGQKEGARVAVNPEKHSSTDFALWKFSHKEQTRDMEWDSPWGKGFPGWHLECSAMAKKFLGDTLDIHAGGIDHIPVHHTNEIAQSEAANEKPLARLWFHSNFITVEGQKISKSLQNGISLQQVLEKGYSLMALRLLILQSHYQTQADFSWKILEAAQARLAGFQALVDLRFQQTEGGKVTDDDLATSKKVILGSLQNDLNSPEALATLSRLQNTVEGGGLSVEPQVLNQFARWVDEVFGLQLTMSQDITPEQKSLLASRANAREADNWDLSDQLRGKLAKQGIGVRDTPQGQIWYRA